MTSTKRTRKPTTKPTPAPEPAKPHRMTLAQVVERLTERRGASSSVTLKMSAQGVFMPEVNIAAGITDDEVDKLVDQAVRAYTELHTRAGGLTPPPTDKPAGDKEARAAAAIARNRRKSASDS